MENRSYALHVGIFTLVLLTAAVLVALWIARDRSGLQTYEIVSAISVSGLNRQSTVRYQGVPVGKVLSLGLNPQQPGEVRIRIGVSPTTPITESTWAELGMHGVTGLANVELRDNGALSKRLHSTADHIAIIPLRAGLFEKLQQRGDAIMANVEQATQQFERLLSEQNMQALMLTLRNAAAMSQSLQQAGERLWPALDKVGPLVEALDSTARQANHTLTEIAGLAYDARLALANLNAPDGALSTATQSLQAISWAAARLSHDTLPSVSGMARHISAAARGATHTLRRVGESPRSLLFGSVPTSPGPGEPGFGGFGREP